MELLKASFQIHREDSLVRRQGGIAKQTWRKGGDWRATIKERDCLVLCQHIDLEISISVRVSGYADPLGDGVGWGSIRDTGSVQWFRIGLCLG